MNITDEILTTVTRALRAEAAAFHHDSDESEVFTDAADALDDAIDLLKELAQ